MKTLAPTGMLFHECALADIIVQKNLWRDCSSPQARETVCFKDNQLTGLLTMIYELRGKLR
jgi:hypothetical protein